MPNKLIKDLIDKGAVTLKEQGYSIRSREYTLLTWKQFQEFCNKKGYETYLPSHKDEFITELGKCTPPLRQSTIDRKAGSMKMLDLLATKGTWGKGMLNPLQELLPEFNSFLDAQEEYLIKTGYSECTRETMRNYISVVMRYFQNAGISKLEELNSSHVSAYLLTLRGHAKSTVRCEFSRLRKFLSYLYLLGYTSENLAPHVPEYRLGQAQSIIKIWESEEINAVLEGTPFKIAYRTRNEFLLYVVNNLPYRKNSQGQEMTQSEVVVRALDEITSMKILSRIEGDEEKVKAELLASLKEVVSKMLPENMRDSSVSLAKLDEMEKKLSSGYTSFWS